jgi:hypothetical protein
VADGIIYNNYLKTFNINPHCGTNVPITEETNRRALVTGSPEYYQRGKSPETHHGNTADRKAAMGYHKKPLAEMEAVAEEAEHRR